MLTTTGGIGSVVRVCASIVVVSYLVLLFVASRYTIVSTLEFEARGSDVRACIAPRKNRERGYFDHDSFFDMRNKALWVKHKRCF